MKEIIEEVVEPGLLLIFGLVCLFMHMQ